MGDHSNCSLPIEWIDRTCVLTLTPNPTKPRGGVVVLDSWLIEALSHALTTIAAQSPEGFILRSGSNRVFVAGADLAEIDALNDDALMQYLQRGSSAFAQISSLPCPSVAIIQQAALGGGLELAMHCDGLLGVMPSVGEKPWRIGLPECGLGICPGWGGTNMLPARVDATAAIAATAAGTTWACCDVPAGLFDLRVCTAVSGCPGEATTLCLTCDPLEAAIAWIGRQPRRVAGGTPRTITPAQSALLSGAIDSAKGTVAPSEAATAVFAAVSEGVSHGWNAALESEQRSLIRLRHTDVASAKLAAFLKPRS